MIFPSGQSPSGNIITSGNISPNLPRSRSINDNCHIDQSGCKKDHPTAEAKCPIAVYGFYRFRIFRSWFSRSPIRSSSRSTISCSWFNTFIDSHSHYTSCLLAKNMPYSCAKTRFLKYTGILKKTLILLQTFVCTADAKSENTIMKRCRLLRGINFMGLNFLYAYKVQSRPRTFHAPNLIQQLSSTEERRLIQLSSPSFD